ncbi:MAG: hypothetical protein COA78_03460 [Blastopirellula sp.]|nr:MAG: hypothetical protein COA78_03460 [Blastopirellula sp.]
MTIRNTNKLSPSLKKALKKHLRAKRKEANRKMQHEKLEDRQLLAADVSPNLISIQPNEGELISQNDVRNASPRSLVFNFAEVNDAVDLIDPTTIGFNFSDPDAPGFDPNAATSGLLITRGGPDQILGTKDDVTVVGNGNFEGFIGMGDAPNEVVIRFGEALPDDVYRIQVTDALKDMEGDTAEEFTLDFELNLGPQIMSVVPQPVSRNTDEMDPNYGELEVARKEIHIYFNNDDLDPVLAENPEFYQLYFEEVINGVVQREQVFFPISVEYDADTDFAKLTFQNDIDQLWGNNNEARVFRLQVGTKEIFTKWSETISLPGGVGSSFDTATDLTDNLNGNHEFQITASFSNIGLLDHQTFIIDDGTGTNPPVTFELVATGVVSDPSNIAIDISGLTTRGEVRNKIVADLSTSGLIEVKANILSFQGRASLRGTAGNRPQMILPGNSVGIIIDRSQTIVLESEIRNETAYTIEFPGTVDEPGHRDIPEESHLLQSPDTTPGITTRTYNFPNLYGIDPSSPTQEPFQNQITDIQRQRAQEIFELYSYYAGIQFIQVPNDQGSDLQIVTGDLRGLDPTVDTGPGGVAGLAGGNLAIMDLADHDQIGDDAFGAAWQTTAFHEIGHLLGLGHSYDLPPQTIQGSDGDLSFGQAVDRIFPGNHDLAHLKNLYRPESKDIDLYRFELPEAGTLSAEIMAERLTDSSLLDAAVTIYRENGDGSHTVIARNDDYFSEDSFLELELEAGTYFIGVSASGNNVYDPTIEDSGIGGTSQGKYKLQVQFRPDADSALRDAGSAQNSGQSILVQTGGMGFADEETIILTDASGVEETFEIDIVSDLSSPASISDVSFTAVKITTDMRASEVVQALLKAINSKSFDIHATAVGNRIDLSGTAINNSVVLDSSIVANKSIAISQGSSGGAALDGDLDAKAGGLFNFWFHAESPTFDGMENSPRTFFVDKSFVEDPFNPSTGSLTNPFTEIDTAIDVMKTRSQSGITGDVIRVTAVPSLLDNEGLDEEEGDNLQSDNPVYLIGEDPITGLDLEDGHDIILPQGVTMMIDEGVILKFSQGSIIVGSTTVNEDRSLSSLQILGVPERYEGDTERKDRRVVLTSFNEGNGVGNRSYTLKDPIAGDWGGIILNNEVDRQQGNNDWESRGIFLNSIIGADIRYAGGTVSPEGSLFTPTAIYMEESRPTINFNKISNSAGAALSADPDSFEESNFQMFQGDAAVFTPDIERVGPDIFGNDLDNNSLNGILVRVRTAPGQDAQGITVAARFDDTDIVHVLQENLEIESTLSGPTRDSFGGPLTARLDGSLVIDASIVVKLNRARIETQIGANFIAEGSAGSEVIFTSINDDRFGFGGTFDTNNNGTDSLAAPGDWAGLYFGHASSGSLDHIMVSYAGGESRIEGGSAHFNPLEIHQADVRLTHSLFEYNEDGRGASDDPNRSSRMSNASGTIFVRGAQPIIVGNNMRSNMGPVINIDVNSLNYELITDYGRATGNSDIQPGLADNQGPLIRHNLLTSNDVNGMEVRAGTLTTEVVWDDTDIVHVVYNTVYIPDMHTYGGLRLESSSTESLVVKFLSDDAGLWATGNPLDIDDRIGGMLHVIGQPGFPVVMTSLHDDTVGAGFDEFGQAQNDTGGPGTVSPGDWMGIVIDENAYDRNVALIVESESNNLELTGINGTPQNSQALGLLAPDEFAGDDNQRLGYNIQGFLSSAADADVYSFEALPGTEVWFDIDRSTHYLDPVIELIDTAGNVIARSVNSQDPGGENVLEIGNPNLFAVPGMEDQVNELRKSGFYDLDRWSTNPRDAGMRVVLPGIPGPNARTYHVRVRSNSGDLGSGAENLTDGITAGVYQMQIRLSEVDEFAGSTVRYADIRNAINGISVFGQPSSSPLLGESAEDANDNNDTFGNAHDLGNIFNSDHAALSVAGNLDTAFEAEVDYLNSIIVTLQDGDIDWYSFDLQYDNTQTIPGTSDENLYASLVFDLDYAAGLARANAIISVFDEDGALILTSQDSGISDDLNHPEVAGQSDTNSDLSRGSTSNGDPLIGNISLPVGKYYIAVSNQGEVPVQMDQFFQANAANPLVRFEPVDSVRRIVEDRISGAYYNTTAIQPGNPYVDSDGDGTIDSLDSDSTSILNNTNRVSYNLGDFTLFLSRDDGTGTRIFAVDPFTGATEANVGKFGQITGDIAMHPDGTLYTYDQDQNGNLDDLGSGNFFAIDTGDGSVGNAIRHDGMLTYERDANNAVVRSHPVGGGRIGWGYEFEASAFVYTNSSSANGLNLYTVGSRGDVSLRSFSGDSQSKYANILFEMDASDSDGDNRPIGSPEFFHGDPNVFVNYIGGSNARPTGRIRTDLDFSGTGFVSVPDGDTLRLYDGYTFVINYPGGPVTYEFDVDNEGTTDPANTAVSISSFDTATEVADAIVFASGFTATNRDPNTFRRTSLIDFGAGTSLGTQTNPINAFRNNYLQEGGRASGGYITGIAAVDRDLYGVTETGGLFLITTGGGFGGFSFGTDAYGTIINTTYIDQINTTIQDLITAGELPFGYQSEFTSVTSGPQNGNGNTDYADVLFISDSEGRIIAVDTLGVAQPIFHGDRAVIETGIFGVQGIEFGTLNRNLWHTSGTRGKDAGHGLVVPVTNSNSADVLGGTSFYFGNEVKTFVEENAYGNATKGNYNLPGDAHGSIISDPFSLYGYDAADLPTLYFNYFLDTDGADHDDDGTITTDNSPLRDALKVFAADENGNWELLGTNNSFHGPDSAGKDDPYDRINDFFGGARAEDSIIAVAESDREFNYLGDTGVQELFDNEGWRQARIDLSAFAGHSDIRLRFDFSTGGSINLGGSANGVEYNTEEIRARAGEDIVDGELFTIRDSRTGTPYYFEFNKGQTITTGTGSGFNDGEGFVLTDSNGTMKSFEFDTTGTTGSADVTIEISPNMSAAETAVAVFEAISSAGFANVTIDLEGTINPAENDNQINLRGFNNIVSLPSGLATLGSDGYNDTFANNIEVDSSMSSTEVANVINTRLHEVITPKAEVLGYEMFKQFEEFIFLNGYEVSTSFNSTIGTDDFLQSDNYGTTSPTNEQANNSKANQRGQANLSQGAFIDDLIIGFRERGEMVTGASNNATAFTTNTQLRNHDVLEGQYQLEIRRGTEYGEGVPSLSGAERQFLFYTIDTNDRLIEGTSINTVSGNQLNPGTQLEVNDGVDFVVFEFVDNEYDLNGQLVNDSYDTANGIYSIGYNKLMSAADIANILSSAINDTQGQADRGLIEFTRELGVFAQVNIRSSTFNITRGQVDLSPKSTSDVALAGNPSDARGPGEQRGSGEELLNAIRATSGSFSYKNSIAIDNVPSSNPGGIIAPQFANEADDIIALATSTGIDGLLGSPLTYLVNGFIGDNFGTTEDVDLFKLEVSAGQRIQIDVDAATAGSTLDGMLRLFYEVSPGSVIEIGFPADDIPSPGEVFSLDPYIDVIAPATGTYYVGVSGFNNSSYNPEDGSNGGTFDSEGSYTMSISLEGYLVGNQSNGIGTSSQLTVDTFNMFGDQNTHRDQGQIILQSNRISNSEEYGILLDASPRDIGGNLPHQGAPNIAATENVNRFATGVTVTNNVIFGGGDGAIHISGDSIASSDPLAAVPFGRVINNTLYGNKSGDTGIRIDDAAGPTLLNNIVANFNTAIDVIDATSQDSTVVNRTAYQNNNNNLRTARGNGESAPLALNQSDPLFVDAANANFYLAPGALVIDAAVDSLEERTQVSSVINPLGIEPSPILAPTLDQTGQLRVDDPSVVSSGGVGSVSFRDIGALERADFNGPRAFLLSPQDNDSEGVDLDPQADVVQLLDGPMSNISIQLFDSGSLSDQAEGSGIDDNSVTSASVIIEQIRGLDPTVLVEGIDYRFDYDATNNIIRIVPISGVFEEGVIYRIILDKDDASPNAIRDVAGNVLEPNKTAMVPVLDPDTGEPMIDPITLEPVLELAGITTFQVQVGGLLDFGDLPNDDVFSFDTLLIDNGARHIIKDSFFLGDSIDAELEGTPSILADLDGPTDDGIYIQAPNPDDLDPNPVPWTVRPVVSNQLFVKTTIPIGSTEYGFLDAWIDFDFSGTFEPNEQVVISHPLTADASDRANSPEGQEISLSNIPTGSKTGQTYARFRFSSTGGLDSNGLAVDGEVEDYVITIGEPGENPWHNPVFDFAVNFSDNIVTFLDVAPIVYELNNREHTFDNGNFRKLYKDLGPNEVHAYLDVNGDNKVNPNDLLDLADFIFSGDITQSPEPIEFALDTSSVSASLEAPITIEAIQPIATSVAVQEPVVQSTLVQDNNVVDIYAPSYSELSMQPYAASIIKTVASVETEAAIDDIVSLDNSIVADDIESIIAAVADDLTDIWDNAEEDEDSFDELLDLIADDSVMD